MYIVVKYKIDLHWLHINKLYIFRQCTYAFVLYIHTVIVCNSSYFHNTIFRDCIFINFGVAITRYMCISLWILWKKNVCSKVHVWFTKTPKRIVEPVLRGRKIGFIKTANSAWNEGWPEIFFGPVKN